MNKRKRLNLILLVFVIILVLGLGYAYLSTTLSINGTTDVDANTWNVYWDNVQVTSGSVTGSQVTTAPTIDTNKTTVSFQVRLSKPGEYYEFTVDAKNTGSIDAMIDTITKTTSIPDYLKYEVTYNDDIPIEENHKLNANDTQTYKVKVEYKTDINANQLPSSSSSTTLTFGTTYIQADSNAVAKPYYMYSNYGNVDYIGDAVFEVGENPPSGVTLYNSNTNASLLDNSNIFLRHLMRDNKVLKSNVCYYNNGKSHCIDANNYSSLTQNEKNIIISDFGSSNCSDNSSYFTCHIDDNPSIQLYINDYYVDAGGIVREYPSFCRTGFGNDPNQSVCSFQ